MNNKTTNLLKELGIPTSLKGYHYLKDAIQMTINNQGILLPLTKIVYPTIADKYEDATPARVERAIRHAVEKVFADGSETLISDIFKYTIHAAKGKVTNGEFIAIVAEYLMQSHTEG